MARTCSSGRYEDLATHRTGSGSARTTTVVVPTNRTALRRDLRGRSLPMAEIKLHATPRAPQGTRSVRRLRGDGKIPGVVYGLGGDPITLSVDWRELRAA